MRRKTLKRKKKQKFLKREVDEERNERNVCRNVNKRCHGKEQPCAGPTPIYTFEGVKMPNAGVPFEFSPKNDDFCDDQKTGDMLETVDKVFWFLEMEPELYVTPHRVGLDYLHHSRKDEIFQKVMSTPFDLVIVDELFATAQGAMALNLRKTFGTKVATFSTTGSVKEGICSDTAMLFLPFFADQPRNALFARELGVAEFMYKKNITVDELSYKIHKVLDDSNYGQRIRKSVDFLQNYVPTADTVLTESNTQNSCWAWDPGVAELVYKKGKTLKGRKKMTFYDRGKLGMIGPRTLNCYLIARKKKVGEYEDETETSWRRKTVK
ncbi:hypothetical protein NECAME_07256 [Necator americanus]|uniref:Uncharacterized protein n=1 Tax=Necator americanus TaxID=51031 RepID=W2TPW1_NECAM|nr:hypothetical protein NECAME_07256 [Necator americanus]ETN83714.1 hypothetical protein NECAME_07256 [Necator americanus]